MPNHTISVSEALQKLEAGESLSNCSIDFDRIKIEVLDVMKLSRAGITVPESAIYYDDDDIAHDEDFEGDWVRVDTDNKPVTEVRITLQDDVKQWVEENHIPLDQLIENLLHGFYRAQKITTRKA